MTTNIDSNQKNNIEQIQQLFFSKDTISGLNKILLQQPSINNLTREGKQELINILVKNMKTVFRSLDLSKIKTSNIKSIFEQYRDHSIKLSINELKQNNFLSDFQQSPTDLKFQRDFHSNPNPGNKIMNRPETTKHFNPTSLNQQIAHVEKKRHEQRKNNDPFSAFSSDMGNYDSNLDQAFKPIVDNINQTSFNNYSSRSDNIQHKIDDIQQMRQSEVNNRNERPTTPDALKPIDSNPSRQNNKSSQQQYQQTQQPVLRGGKPDFKNMNSNQFNQGFQGLSNDLGGDLYSVDNIDQPLTNTNNIVEDTTPFEDRLKQLQSDRQTIKIPVNQGKINFTSENFPKSNVNSNTFEQPIKQSQDIQYQNKQQYERQQYERQQQERQQQERQQYERQQQERQQQERQQYERQQQERQQQERQHQERQQQERQQQERQQQERQQQERQQYERQHQERQQQERQHQERQHQERQQQERQQYEINNQIEQSNQNNKLLSLKTSMKSLGVDINENQISELKNTIQKLLQENNEYRELISKLKNDSNDSEIKKIQDIKKQIATEYQELENKLSEYQSKEILINKREKELKQLITNYEYINKLKQLQLEVSNTESSYKWSINKILNVTGIKLMSYSIPSPKFNIENKKNNILKILIDEEEKKIIIEPGKYSIEELINEINENNEYISVSLNTQQKIVIVSNNEKEFDIIPTLLSEINLGFVTESKNKNKHIANRIWDLRMETKIYLYINNLSSEIPFGVLYFNNQTECQFKFQKPYNLDLLDISFKDSKGNDYLFNGLEHSLSFMIEKVD